MIEKLSGEFVTILTSFIPFMIVLTIVILALAFANWFFLYRKSNIGEEARFTKRLLMIMLWCTGGVIIILSFPVDSTTKGHLLSLLGILLSAVIALSSTTFVSNAMAGLMVRMVCRFSPGDFIRIDGQYGRVTERGLIHTEIQTEERDLVTIPNLYLVTHPVKVTRSSGTIVSATVSLGYDVSSDTIEALLIESAAEAELQDPFVQILELGDFSVSYRIAGFLTEVKQILTARSKLRKMILNTLHGAGVEIVSPSFMNQRPLNPENRIIPPARPSTKPPVNDNVPEELIFDKAEEAEKIEHLKQDFENLENEIATVESELKKADEVSALSLKAQLKYKESKLEKIKEEIRDTSGPEKDEKPKE